MIDIKWGPYLSGVSIVKKETGLYLRNSILEEMITKFVLNEILYHVGMSWIICSSEKIKYEIEESNHTDWLNKVPWYNTAICSRLHGSLFEDFITHARTDRYNLLCYLVAHDNKNLLMKMMKAVLEIG